MLSALALLALVHQGPDLTEKVTFECDGASAPAALRELSKVTGYTFEGSTAVANEVLVIRVENVPLGDLLSRIARVTTGRWEEYERKQVLVRDDVLAARQLQEAYLARVEKSKLMLQNFAKRLVKDVEIDLPAVERNLKRLVDLKAKLDESDEERVYTSPEWKEFDKLQRQSPGATIMEELVLCLTPQQIASVPLGERRVFALSPTRMQLALPTRAGAVIGRYLRRTQVLREAASSLGLLKIDDQGETDLPYLVARDLEPLEGAEEVLLQVEPYDFGDSVAFEATLLDDRGRELTSWELNCVDGVSETDEENDSVDQRADSWRELMNVRRGEEPLKIVGLGKELIDWTIASRQIAQGITKQHSLAISPRLRDALLNPETVDPASYFTGQGFVLASKAEGMNLVANVPDEIISMNGFTRNPDQLTLRQFIGIVDRSRTVDMQKADGWWIVRPRDPSAARAARCDRKDLGKLVRNASAKGTLMLDDVASFAARNSENAWNMLALPLAMIAVPGTDYQSIDGSFDMYRLYGSLTVLQRTTLSNGESLTIRSLSPGQKAQLTRMIYYLPDSALNGSAGWSPVFDDEEGTIQLEGSPLPDHDEVSNEPTERLPYGLPDTGLVTLAIKQQPIFQTIQARRGFGGRTMGLRQIAMASVMKEFPSLFPNQGISDIGRVKQGTMRQYRFVFSLGAGLGYVRTLRDVALDQTQPAVSIESLPEDVRAKLDALMEELRAAFKRQENEQNVRPPSGGRGGPPPRAANQLSYTR
jgi:hypothetical protein